jgi:hypothetical protein
MRFQYQRNSDIADDESFIKLTPRSVRTAAMRVTKAAADKYHNDDWEAAFLRDLRRHDAQGVLVNENMNHVF